MHLVHTHDPAPDPSRLLTDEQLGMAITRARNRAKEFRALGEVELASVNERAMDRLLDALIARKSR